MNFSLDRNSFVAKKIGQLNGEVVVDVGCRDKIFKDKLSGKFQYIGIDFIDISDDNNLSIKPDDFLNHNLENGLPNQLENADIINALDVLEHVENIHQLFLEFFNKSKKIIIIALPNMAYYKFRLNFLMTGSLSGKYLFKESPVKDKHRWIPNYHSINTFVNKNLNNNWEYKEYDFIAERKNNFIIYFIEKFLSKFFPNLFVYEKIFFFYKKVKS
jgi:2-polyprenyl-3-methyl-5-hydroxy-6-metoxy-1,4-benzoquinol methylase